MLWATETFEAGLCAGSPPHHKMILVLVLPLCTARLAPSSGKIPDEAFLLLKRMAEWSADV